MKILITGATGFVGTTLVPFLCVKGFDITLLVRNKEKTEHKFSTLPVHIIVINTNEEWIEMVKSYSPDVVLHLATFFTGRSDIENVKSIIESNITFTTLLLETISHTDCKSFINMGTFSEYFYGSGLFRPNNLYSASKTAVRPIIQYFQTLSKWNWINIILYSPYGRKNEQKKVLDYMIDAIGVAEPVVFTKGEQILDFIHVDDIADFFYALITRIPDLHDSFYEFHLGTGVGHSIREVGHIMERIWGENLNGDWGGRIYSSQDIMYAVAPIGKNIKLLNWKAKLSLEEGLKIFKDDIEKNDGKEYCSYR